MESLPNGGLNIYGYPLNPLQFIDPLGLLTCTPRDEEECAKLRKRIFDKSAGLLHEFQKYDLVEDGKGGFPTKWGKLTVPGGHYKEMTDFQRGLNTDIAKYKKDCLDKDRCDGKGKWTAIPRSIDEMANRPIDPPVIPPPAESTKTDWGTIGGVVAGTGAAICLVVEPCGAAVAAGLGFGSILTLSVQ
ncbi:hypothetical protein [Shigella boydii]|nr:hypothetical protein [Shigella boydii]